MGDTVKENLWGRTYVAETCLSERERLSALKRWFSIELTEDEQEGIVGWRTQLPDAV